MDNFDRITIGNTITERFLEDNRTILFESIGKEYDLKYRSDLISNQADFKLDNDNSKVYEVIETYSQKIEYNQTNGKQKTIIVDSENNIIESTRNALNVSIQDPENISVNYYFYQLKATTNPTQSYTTGSSIINVANATGAIQNNVINIKTATRFYQGLIKTINGTAITISPKINFDITSSTIVEFGDYNMNKNGSVTPVEFILETPINTTWHVKTMNFSILDQTEMDDAKFGGLTALTNGLSLTKEDGVIENYWLIYSNIGFEENGYTTKYSSKAPAGYYGFNGRKDIIQVNGTILKLENGEQLKIVVNDDLTGLNKMVFTINGHIII